jgi:hypothetical protein
MATRKKPPVIVDDGVGPEILASAIVGVAESAKRLLGSRLDRRAIVVLIQELCSSKVSRADINAVLDAASRLDTLVRK